MRMMTVVPWLILAACVPAPAAEAIYSGSVATGWTDNATDTAAGRADLFVETEHEATIGVDLGWAVLRGTIGAQSRHHYSVKEADDWSARTGLSIDIPLDGIVLRGSAQLSRVSEGKFILIEEVLVPLRSERSEGEIGLEMLAEVAGERRSAVGATWRGVFHDPTSFPSLPVAAERISADVGMFTLSARHEAVAGDRIVIGGEAAYRQVHVPEGDEEVFGRHPVSAFELRLGIEARPIDGLTVKANGGATSVVDPAGLVTAQVLPVGRLEIEGRVGQFQLGGVAAADLELFDPVDGVAGRKLGLALRLRHPGPSNTVFLAALDASHEEGVAERSVFKRKLELSVALEGAMAPGFAYRIGVSQGVAEDNAGGYGTRTFRVGLSGKS